MALLTRRPEFIDWQSFPQSRGEFDFITAFASASAGKDLFEVIEFKKVAEQTYYKQISSYLWKHYLNAESLTWQVEAIPDIILKRFIEPVAAKRLVNVIYVNRSAIDILLGSQGKAVLEKVVTLVQDTAHEESWPLEKIEIRHIRDFEVKDWEYIVVVLAFNCTFETANAYLEDIYQRLDALVEKLSIQGRELIANLIYLDIATNEDVPGS